MTAPGMNVWTNWHGRPHWGKLHNLNADQIGDRYPGRATFEEIRRQFDPDGQFLSPYLRNLGFGS